MIYVIGSGVAGVSAAVALVNKGLHVTMLDAGVELEPERMKIVRRLWFLDKDKWDRESIRQLKGRTVAHSGGVVIKYVYGSDYPYRGMDRYQPVKLRNAKMVRSLARGGLSNVWGGAILPYIQSDIRDWPITTMDLAPHYRAVLSFVAHSGKKDGLSNILPLYDEGYHAFRPCRQASAFLEDLQRNREALEAEGVFFGHSRLAVRFNSDQDSRACVYCGMCLYGCPYGCIYSATATLDWLLSKRNFHYMKSVLVEKVLEANGGVRILAKSLTNSDKLEFRGSRVLLAAGTVSSLRIILQSLEAFDHPLVIKHSEHFQIPLIRYRKIKDVTTEDLHTLVQLYIEFIDKSVSENTVHMQVYAYNDFYGQVINGLIGPLASIFKCPIEEILGRLLVIKGYLHSKISSCIVARLETGKGGGRLILEGRPNDEARRTVKKITAKLFRNRRYLKAVPAPKMTKIDGPGIGNHSGGSFPMKKRPGEFETDELGRPYGFKNLHVVDSTIFPSIPATTISLTIMANAHRIASAF